MKKKVFIAISMCVLLTVVFLLSNKWNTPIYMGAVPLSPKDKIDLKISIDDEIIFNDTLHSFNFIRYPMRVGYHTISISSKKVDYQRNDRIFIFFHQYIFLEYSGISASENVPVFKLGKGNINSIYMENKKNN